MAACFRWRYDRSLCIELEIGESALNSQCRHVERPKHLPVGGLYFPHPRDSPSELMARQTNDGDQDRKPAKLGLTAYTAWWKKP